MKSYLFQGNGNSRAQTPQDLCTHRQKRGDSANQSDYAARRVQDTPAIEAHIRGCKLPLTRIASMYGYPVEFIEQIEKDIWAKDAVYRLNKVSYS